MKIETFFSTRHLKTPIQHQKSPSTLIPLIAILILSTSSSYSKLLYGQYIERMGLDLNKIYFV